MTKVSCYNGHMIWYQAVLGRSCSLHQTKQQVKVPILVWFEVQGINVCCRRDFSTDMKARFAVNSVFATDFSWFRAPYLARFWLQWACERQPFTEKNIGERLGLTILHVYYCKTSPPSKWATGCGLSTRQICIDTSCCIGFLWVWWF